MTTISHPQKVRVLYKTILRLHRGMPPALQTLGNNYAREEFKRHKNCPEQEAQIFMLEWTNYAITIAKQLGLRGRSKGTLGSLIDVDELEHFKPDQLEQLYELSKAARGIDEPTDTNKQQSK